MVAVMTDVARNGKPVVGYGFNSNGGYGQGWLIRERFALRIPDSLAQRQVISFFGSTRKR